MGQGVGARSRALAIAMWTVLALDVAWLLVQDGQVHVVVNGLLEAGSLVLPPALCWSALRTAGPRRREVVLVALAQTSFAVGAVAYTVGVVVTGASTPPFPSVADAFYLGTYALLLPAVVCAVRRELRGVGTGVLLDGMLGALGAGAALSVLLAPVLVRGWGSPLASAVALAYPLFDLVLVAGVVGIVAVQGLQRRWVPLLLGLGVLAAADASFALRTSSGHFRLGTGFDALWAVGLSLIALWALDPGRDRRGDEAPGTGVLLVPALATASGLSVLVWSAGHSASPLSVVLATLTVVATAGRTQVAFVQLRRLADLRRQAGTDELTGLPNRRSFSERATVHLSAPGARAALLVLDLDRFKDVNDGLGHGVGDALLRRVGARLGDELRPGDLLARLGGDEFAVLLPDTDGEEAVAVAARLRAALVAPVVVEGVALRTAVSVGIALAPLHGDDLTGLLRRADIAMYRAKRSRAGCCTYDPAGDVTAAARLQTQEELRSALETCGLVLHYQPKLDLRTAQVHGVEALVRWDHPSRGLLYPDAFLPVAEDAGLMGPLTDVVLAQALDQAVRWRAQGRPLTVAVNLSASSLTDVGLPERVARQLADRGLPPQALQLEITEDFVMADRERASTILAGLRRRGVQIAVDDFGTGYSSLAYLRDLPVDELKLDRSFVLPMSDDPRAAALVASTVALAHGLGLRMVAEGVEDAGALAELTRLGCDEAQGYHVSRPVPAAALEQWLSLQEARAAVVVG